MEEIIAITVEEEGSANSELIFNPKTFAGRDINLDVLRVNGYRNFCNKLWNATKFAMMNLQPPFKPYSSLEELKKKIPKQGLLINRDKCLNELPLPLNCEALDSYLRAYSYMGGHEPSQSDAQLLVKILDSSFCMVGFPHLLRWYSHISSFSLEERKAFNGLSYFSSDALLTKTSSGEEETCMSVLDRWMMSQLSYAVSECSAAFHEFNFPRATTALYNLWWYQICDVYLECIKGPMKSASEKRKEVIRNVLYTCLRTGLLLISPFMPFLSEELFQRLPPMTEADPPSICVTSYPETEQYDVFSDSEVEDRFKYAQKVVNEIRSSKAKYDVPHKMKIELCLQTDREDIKNILNDLIEEICALSYAASIKFTDEKPKGSVPSPVGTNLIVWMKLEGLVDIKKCEERLLKRKLDNESKLKNLLTEMLKLNLDKVPEEVRTKNEERHQSLSGEIEQDNDALKQLKQIDW